MCCRVFGLQKCNDQFELMQMSGPQAIEQTSKVKSKSNYYNQIHYRTGALQADLELIEVDTAFDDGLCRPAGLHEGDDERGREEVQALIGGLDPKGSTAHKGQHTEPAVPVHQLTGPRGCDDVCNGLGEEHAPGACTQCASVVRSSPTVSVMV